MKWDENVAAMFGGGGTPTGLEPPEESPRAREYDERPEPPRMVPRMPPAPPTVEDALMLQRDLLLLGMSVQDADTGARVDPRTVCLDSRPSKQAAVSTHLHAIAEFANAIAPVAVVTWTGTEAPIDALAELGGEKTTRRAGSLGATVIDAVTLNVDGVQFVAERERVADDLRADAERAVADAFKARGAR